MHIGCIGREHRVQEEKDLVLLFIIPILSELKKVLKRARSPETGIMGLREEAGERAVTFM